MYLVNTWEFRRLISQLLVTFMQGKTNKREVLELMARILNFSDEDKHKIGLISRWSAKPEDSLDKSDKVSSPLRMSFSGTNELLFNRA